MNEDDDYDIREADVQYYYHGNNAQDGDYLTFDRNRIRGQVAFYNHT